MYDLTVIIPTFKEEANIRNIVTEVDAVFKRTGTHGEILIVDDNSPDGTVAIVNEMKTMMPNVSLLVRTADHGLSQSVADGFLHASSDIFVVIDADFSHPPSLIPKMYEENPGRERCSHRQQVHGWRWDKEMAPKTAYHIPWRNVSWAAAVPGYHGSGERVFCRPEERGGTAQLKPRGYKILLEVLGKGVWEHDKEIPFEFSDREIGSSKLNIKTIVEYAQQVVDITLYRFAHRQSAAWREWKKVFKFGIVGLTGIVVNEGLLICLKEYAGLLLPVASVIAIESQS